MIKFIYPTFVALLLANVSLAQNAEKVFSSAKKSCVQISIDLDADGVKDGCGSGFFIEKDLICTNYHVIKGAAVADISFIGEKKQYAVDGYVALDELNDLAILHVASCTRAPLKLSTKKEVNVGAETYAIGSPKCLELGISAGIVNRIQEGYGIGFSASVSTGNSGGPLLDINGKVVGVVYSQLVEGQNLNWAVPKTKVIALLNSRSKEVHPLPIEDTEALASEDESTFDWATHYYNLGTNTADDNEAIAYYGLALIYDPYNGSAYGNRAILYNKQELYSLGLEDAENAILYNKNASEIYIDYYTKAKAEFQMDLFHLAKEDIEMCLSYQPSYPIALTLKEKIEEKIQAESSVSFANLYFDRGVELFLQGEYSKAIDMYNKAISYEPNKKLRADILLERACTYKELGNYRSSKKDALDALIYDYQNKEFPYYYIAWAEYSDKKHSDALIYVNKSLSANSSFPPAITLKRLVEQELKPKENWFQKGYDAFAKEDYVNAILLYQKHIAEADNDIDVANLNAGLAYYNLKKYREAIPFFSSAIRANSTLGRAYEYRAWSQVELKDLDAAMPDAQNAVKYSKKDGNALGLRAYLHERLTMNINFAIDDYQEALLYKPDYAYAKQQLVLLKKKRDYAEEIIKRMTASKESTKYYRLDFGPDDNKHKLFLIIYKNIEGKSYAVGHVKYNENRTNETKIVKQFLLQERTDDGFALKSLRPIDVKTKQIAHFYSADNFIFEGFPYTIFNDDDQGTKSEIKYWYQVLKTSEIEQLKIEFKVD